MSTIHRARNCVTHHHACDCREYRYMRLEDALETIADIAREHHTIDPAGILAIVNEALNALEDI